MGDTAVVIQRGMTALQFEYIREYLTEEKALKKVGWLLDRAMNALQRSEA